MRWPPSFETPSGLFASSSVAWASLLSESSLLPASLSVALSAFLAAVLSAFLAATLVVLSFLSPFSPLSPISLLSVLVPLLPWSALAAFVLPAAFSGLAAFSLLSGALASFGEGGGAASFFAGADAGCVGTISAITFWRKMATTGQSGESPSVLGKTARSASPFAIAAALALGPSVATRRS